jgi:lipoic acid synthetase
MPETPAGRKFPPWIKVRGRFTQEYRDLRRLMRGQGLHSVCEEAKCPNIFDCFSRRTATFLMLGGVCTRACGFCGIATGRPRPLDPDEPRRVAESIRRLGLRHAVITSVNRDDLPDGGAHAFHEVTRILREIHSGCGVEVLIPDFLGDLKALEHVLDARPDILNHNVETVPSLYPLVRRGAKYDRSLTVLRHAKAYAPGVLSKSGIMVGHGETWDEVLRTMRDIRAAGADILTIGQYLQPSREHLPVRRFWSPGEFEALAREGEGMGYAHVESAPLVRSSYHADEQVSRVPGPPSGDPASRFFAESGEGPEGGELFVIPTR